MAPIDLSHVLEDYENKWVVLSNDESKVLASGDSPEEIQEYAGKGIVMKVPQFDVLFSPVS